jgi:hypothetical protein
MKENSCKNWKMLRQRVVADDESVQVVGISLTEVKDPKQRSKTTGTSQSYTYNAVSRNISASVLVFSKFNLILTHTLTPMLNIQEYDPLVNHVRICCLKQQNRVAQVLVTLTRNRSPVVVHAVRLELERPNPNLNLKYNEVLT